MARVVRITSKTREGPLLDTAKEHPSETTADTAKRSSAPDVETILGPAAGGRTRRRLLWTAAVLAGLAVLYGLWSLRNGTEDVRYTTQPATRGDLTVLVTATGSVQPTNKVDISSELSGTVRKVLVDYNSEVTVGQMLAELDTDKLRATVESSRAKLSAAKAKVTEAQATIEEMRANYARKQSLVEKKVTSVYELDTAKAAHDRAVAAHASALAEVHVAEAELKLNETNLAKASIYSPIKGVVLSRDIDPGQTVASSFQAPVLFTIAEDLTQMELQVDIDEADVGKTRVGQDATFNVDAYPDRKFPARIRDIRFASETVQGVVTYKGLLTVDNSELLLRPGMTATAEIVVQQVKDALLVPNAGLRFSPPSEEQGQSSQSLLRSIIPSMPQFRAASGPAESGPNRTVWVLRDGAPTEVAVVVGDTDGANTEILKGDIAAGDAVIVDMTTGK